MGKIYETLNSLKNRIPVIILIWIILPAYAYTQNSNENHGDQDDFRHHRISPMISHTHIPNGSFAANKPSGIIVPSWGLNYDFWITPRWAIGSHNDMEIAHYVIEDEHGVEIDRERPIILSVVGIFKPTHHIELLAGFGKEFEKHHNYWVYRFGIEYEFDIRNHWMLSPSLIFDLKESVYDSWTLGLVIGKKF